MKKRQPGLTKTYMALRRNIYVGIQASPACLWIYITGCRMYTLCRPKGEKQEGRQCMLTS